MYLLFCCMAVIAGQYPDRLTRETNAEYAMYWTHEQRGNSKENGNKDTFLKQKVEMDGMLNFNKANRRKCVEEDGKQLT